MGRTRQKTDLAPHPLLYGLPEPDGAGGKQATFLREKQMNLTKIWTEAANEENERMNGDTHSESWVEIKCIVDGTNCTLRLVEDDNDEDYLRNYYEYTAVQRSVVYRGGAHGYAQAAEFAREIAEAIENKAWYKQYRAQIQTQEELLVAKAARQESEAA